MDSTESPGKPRQRPAPINNDYTDQYGDRYGWDFFQRAAATQTPDANGPGYSFRMWNGNSSSTESQNLLFNITGGLYTVGAWSHIVAVYDATVPSATLYFNGQQVAQSTTPNGSYYANIAGPMSIGGYPDGTENPFFGQIDEFAVYGTALSAAQVMAHYQNGTNAARPCRIRPLSPTTARWSTCAWTNRWSMSRPTAAASAAWRTACMSILELRFRVRKRRSSGLAGRQPRGGH